LSSSELFRLCGVTAILAGLLFVASDLLDLAVEPATDSVGFGADAFEQDSPSAWLVFESGLTLLAGVLLLFGSIGLYARRTEVVGLLGLFGFVFAFSGTVMAVGAFWSNIFIAPTMAAALAREPAGLLDATPPRALAAGLGLSYGLVSVGWLLFGVAILRARAYPRAGAAALTLGAVLTWLPFPLAGVLFGVGVALVGWYLYSAGTGDVRVKERKVHPTPRTAEQRPSENSSSRHFGE
jgi:hypothetical protein